jgi:hypothetical protein
MARHHMTPDGPVPFTAEEEAARDAEEAAWAEEQKRNAYIYARQAAYPSISDQLDLLYHQGIDGWKAAIQAVKDKYPKG